jgi:hypothetical protein
MLILDLCFSSDFVFTAEAVYLYTFATTLFFFAFSNGYLIMPEFFIIPTTASLLNLTMFHAFL